MPWQEYSNTEERESKYNELAFKMMRIHKLQDKINSLWQNPLGYWYNIEVEGGGQEYGFILLLSALRSLYMEVRPKCNEEEKKQTDLYVDSLYDYINGKNIIIAIQQYGKVKEKIDKDKWKLYQKAIQGFEMLIRDLLDKHGFSPDYDDDSGL